MAVSHGRTCELTRVIDWGGANLDDAISRAARVPVEEATTMKHALSLAPSEPTAVGESDKAREAVLRELHAFAKQLVSSLHFYQNQPGALEIGEIVITGGTAALPGLADELGRLLGASVRVGDPLARVKVGKKANTDGPLGSLAVAIGLGIED